MTELVRLRASSVRARQRPWAIVALWSWEAGLGLVLGASFASVASGAYGRHPDGDSPLFAPGGLALLDLARHSMGARGPLLSAIFLVAALAHVAGLLPNAAVLAELAFSTRRRRAPPARDAISLAVAAFPAAATITMLVMFVQAALIVLGITLGSALPSLAVSRFGEPFRDKLLAGAVMLAVVAAGAVGVVADVARAAVVREGESALSAITSGVVAFWAHPLALMWSYAWRGAVSWVPVAIGAALTTRIDAHSGVTLTVAAVLHQLIIGTRVAIRASWMARTVRAVAR